jgi:hypothetical protein
MKVLGKATRQKDLKKVKTLKFRKEDSMYQRCKPMGSERHTILLLGSKSKAKSSTKFKSGV